MNKCGTCVYFRQVKIIRNANGELDSVMGFCEYDTTSELMEYDEPACRCYIQDTYDVWYQ